MNAKFIAFIFFLTTFPDDAAAQSVKRDLRIEAPADREDAPDVKVLGAPPTSPTFDERTDRWVVPLAVPGSAFVTTYVVKSNKPGILAVRLAIPTRVLETNPFVYLPLPSITMVDEKAMRELWSTTDIFKRPSDVRVQFRGLQDFLFINAELLKRDPESRRLTAMSVRAAFLLFQVVRNLGEKTWFIVDPNSNAIVAHADSILSAADAKGKTCEWLGTSTCAPGAVTKLISAVRYSEATQLNQMYQMLVPARLAAQPNHCTAVLADNMRDFLDFLHATDARGAAAAISEGRVLQDIAFCEARLALCKPHPKEEAIAMLSRLDLLLSEYNNTLTAVRRNEVSNAIEDLRNGSPATCPGR